MHHVKTVGNSLDYHSGKFGIAMGQTCQPQNRMPTHIYKTKISVSSLVVYAGGNLQFLNAILSLETSAAIDLLLAM